MGDFFYGYGLKMNVLIRDLTLRNKAIAEVPVKICGVECTPTTNHYFDVAWLIALDGGLVRAGEKSNYSFECVSQESGV